MHELPVLFVHPAAMLTKVFVTLHIKLDKVAHFDRVDLACAAVADLEDQRTDWSKGTVCFAVRHKTY